MTTKICMHWYVAGKVQGVWFRASTQEEAKRLGVTGWVRNMPDGRVEVFACGEQVQLAYLHEWLKHGPRLAKVADLISETQPWQDFLGFEIR